MGMTGYLLTVTIIWLSCPPASTVSGALTTTESRSVTSATEDSLTELDCDYQRSIQCHPRQSTSRTEGPRVKRSADGQSSLPANDDDDDDDDQKQTRSVRSNVNDRSLYARQERQNDDDDSRRMNLQRFGRAKGGLERNFLRFGRRSDRQRSSDSEGEGDEDESITGNSGRKLERLLDRIRTTAGEIADSDADNTRVFNGKEDHDEQDDDDDDDDNGSSSSMDTYDAMIKRGSLDRNFIRYGRFRAHRPSNVFTGKRGSLDRNFLRFGKRNRDAPAPPSSGGEDDGDNGNRSSDDDASRAQPSSKDNNLVSI